MLTMMSKSNSLRHRALKCALLSVAVFALVGAGDPASRFKEIGHRLVCICGACGELLLECNHVGCAYSDSMRNELMAAVQRGDSDSLVEQSFVQKYGPTVLAAPTSSGFDRTAWIFPFVAFALGVIAVVSVVRAWKKRPRPTPAFTANVKAAELNKFREQAREETEL
jgi:cytochrome c-type biogenesis protein CcmH